MKSLAKLEAISETLELFPPNTQLCSMAQAIELRASGPLRTISADDLRHLVRVSRAVQTAVEVLRGMLEPLK